MKLFLLLSLSLLVACASKRDNIYKVSDASWDSLSEESFVRWDDQRLITARVSDNTVIKCHAGKTDKALKEYREQYNKRSNNPHYWLHVGNCFYLDNELNQSEFFYRLSLEESKHDVVKAMAWNNIANVYLKFGQWTKAKDALERSIKLSPKSRTPKYNLAQIYLQFGLSDKAIALLSDEVFRGVKDVDIFHSLAMASLMKGDTSKTDEYLKKIPDSFYTRDDIAITASLYHLRKGEVNEASMKIKNREPASDGKRDELAKKIETIIEMRSQK